MTKAVVVDTSVLIRYRFREPSWENTRPLVDAIQRRQTIAYAPPHLLLEFFHAAHRKTQPLADRKRALKRHFDWLMSLPIDYIDVDYLAEARSLRLFVGAGAGSYDALYVYLAKHRRIPLCTCDVGIVRLSSSGGLRLKISDLDTTAYTP